MMNLWCSYYSSLILYFIHFKSVLLPGKFEKGFIAFRAASYFVFVSFFFYFYLIVWD